VQTVPQAPLGVLIGQIMFNIFRKYEEENTVPYKVIATVPAWQIGGFKMLNAYLRASAGLDWLDNTLKLEVHYMEGIIHFVCRSKYHLDYIKKNFRDTLICPPAIFAQKNAIKTSRPIEPINDDYYPDDMY